MRFIIFTLWLLGFSTTIFAQSSPVSISEIKYQKTGSDTFHIDWKAPVFINLPDDREEKVIYFSGAQYALHDKLLPRYYQDVEINDDGNDVSISFINTVYEPLSESELPLLRAIILPDEIKLTNLTHIVKKQKKGGISFIPLRRNASTGKPEKLLSYDLKVSYTNTSVQNHTGTTFLPSANSILQTGKWYRISLTNDGIYKLTYQFFKQLGIQPEAINPKYVRIYGNGGGMLPRPNSESRADDLQENAIHVEGESDGVFDKEDYVLFYGQGPQRWKYHSDSVPAFRHITHLYSDSTCYFINVDMGPGKRIATQPSSASTPTHLVNSFDDYAVHEYNDRNLIHSGSTWYGEYFDNIDSYDFSFHFPFIEQVPATVNVAIAAKHEATDSYYQFSCQSGTATVSIIPINPKGYDYAHMKKKSFQFIPSGGDLNVNVKKQTPTAIAWLDYIEVNVRRKLIMSGHQFFFRDSRSVGAANIAKYMLETTVPVKIWDVTDPTNVQNQVITPGNISEFALPADRFREFLAFTGQTYLTPQVSGSVENQNLHGLPQKDFVIVAHPDFLVEAKQLAAIHEKEDQLSTVVVTPQQVYNEFSSGIRDITAIRDFMRMFYNRSTSPSQLPKYLLLFGDGSYDNKKNSESNTNFIPTYESEQSTNYTKSFVSDDYYGFLDDTEGIFDPESQEAVDIGVGRLPVKSKSEAQAAINKILQYIKKGIPPTIANDGCSNNQSSPFGDWRNVVCLVADDEDDNTHIIDTEELADIIDTTYTNYNMDKIYMDAYKQESTPGGERYPDVNEAIEKRMEKGCLIFNYTGHGGEVGLAHERIVNVSMINKWSNINNMPLFFTATCEFSRYDDPSRTSAGEYAFLNPKGGAIAMFTTVRLVYSAENSLLNKSFMNRVFKPLHGEMPRLGDIFQLIKSETVNLNLNSRNFSLFGDPALRIAYPNYTIVTDSINGSPVVNGNNDTLKALSHISVSGHVESNSSILSDYNGVLYPTVFNKVQHITTLSNNIKSQPYTFEVQRDVLYKGKASITNGRFRYEFIVPKDIAYQYGDARISYYGENGKEDASGYFENITVGGTSDTAKPDHNGPAIELYMNDEKFINGGTTNEKPDLFAVLKDAHGINTVGNGIGHDIIAVLDANTDHSIVLNDFYQADLNSYKSGTIRYPFKDLPEGKHTLSLKAWDVYNNSSQATIEFVVSSSSEFKLERVLNYPNPFTTKTQFLFEHNQCCQFLNVQVQIFTVSGKLVKTLNKYVFSEGYRLEPIEWDGRDDFGDKIGRGVYVYRLKIKTSKGNQAEKFEKLVILN